MASRLVSLFLITPLVCDWYISNLFIFRTTVLNSLLTHMIEDEIFVFWSLVGFHRLVAWSKHCNKAEKQIFLGMLKMLQKIHRF